MLNELSLVDLPADVMQTLCDALPDVVFFVKGTDGRYTHANLTLVRRLGLKQRSDVIGRPASELFEPALGAAYAAQDRRVMAGESIDAHLEVHLFPNRAPGWCLTCKQPLYRNGRIAGLVGISRDLGRVGRRIPSYERLRELLDDIGLRYNERVRVQELAERAGWSVAQLERLVRRVFQLTPQQLLAKIRIDAAMRLLAGKTSIAEIGLRCGFSDQSAFARQFRATVGTTPRRYRGRVAPEPGVAHTPREPA